MSNVRGSAEVACFSAAMIETLNNERNGCKPHWSKETFHALLDKLKEERREVDDEIAKYLSFDADEYAVIRELIDEANVLMMLADNLRKGAFR